MKWTRSPAGLSEPDLLSMETEKRGPAQVWADGTDLLHGVHPVACAVAAQRRDIRTVFYVREAAQSPRVRPVLEQCWSRNIETRPVVRSQVEKMIPRGRPHQGLFAKVSPLHFEPTPNTVEGLQRLHDDPEPAAENEKRLWLFLDSVQDPMNFGSILRTAYWFGVHKIFVSSQNSCSLTPVVSKASSGVMELIPVHSVADPVRFVALLRQADWSVLATGRPSPDTDVPCLPVAHHRLEKPTLLLLGNEGRGIPAELMKLCHMSVHIEANTRTTDVRLVDSLNLSAAAAVLLHSLLSR